MINRQLKYFGLFLSSLALFFLYHLAFQVNQVYDLKGKGGTIKGVVDSIYSFSTTDSEGVIYLISYTISNQTYSIKNEFMQMDNRYLIDDSVEIIYDKLDPSIARINSKIENAYPIYLLLGAIVICLSLSYVLFFKQILIYRLASKFPSSDEHY